MKTNKKEKETSVETPEPPQRQLPLEKPEKKNGSHQTEQPSKHSKK